MKPDITIYDIANAGNLFHKRVDGLVVSLAYDTENMDHFQPYLHENIPMVFFDRVEADFPAPRVIIDNKQAGYDAPLHLIDQGCRIAHLITRASSIRQTNNNP